MTIREYIQSKLQAFPLTDGDYADIALEVGDVDEVYISSEHRNSVTRAIISLIEDIAFRPHFKQVNESGFSATWEYELGKYYILLCKKVGQTPNEDILQHLGVSRIKFMDLADYL